MADDAVPAGAELLPGIAPAQLDGPFVGLGAAVGEKDPVRKGQAHQRLRQFHHGRGVIDVGDVHQLRQLGRRGPGDLRVGVAQVAHRQPGHEVEVFLAGIVPHPAAFAPTSTRGCRP